jgi:hypothetical protein
LAILKRLPTQSKKKLRIVSRPPKLTGCGFSKSGATGALEDAKGSAPFFSGGMYDYQFLGSF